MNRKDLIVILAAILVAGFFMPVVEWDSFEMSGFNFVLSSFTPDTKYIILFIPLSGLFLLSGIKNNRKSDLKQNPAHFIPFITVIILFIAFYRESPGSFSIGDLDFGFWVALVASLLLIFVKPVARATAKYPHQRSLEQ